MPRVFRPPVDKAAGNLVHGGSRSFQRLEGPPCNVLPARHVNGLRLGPRCELSCFVQGLCFPFSPRERCEWLNAQRQGMEIHHRFRYLKHRTLWPCIPKEDRLCTKLTAESVQLKKFGEFIRIQPIHSKTARTECPFKRRVPREFLSESKEAVLAKCHERAGG